MEVEIVYDPIEEALAEGLLMDSRHVVLPDGEFIQWLRRISGHPDLFLYYHVDTKNFVLAEWLLDPSTTSVRLCLELDCFDGPPDSNWDKIEGEEFWKLRLTSQHEQALQVQRAIRDRQYEQRQAKIESAASRKSVSKWLGRKGMEVESHLMDIGATPHIGEREAKFHGVHGQFDEVLKG